METEIADTEICPGFGSDPRPRRAPPPPAAALSGGHLLPLHGTDVGGARRGAVRWRRCDRAAGQLLGRLGLWWLWLLRRRRRLRRLGLGVRLRRLLLRRRWLLLRGLWGLWGLLLLLLLWRRLALARRDEGRLLEACYQRASVQ